MERCVELIACECVHAEDDNSWLILRDALARHDSSDRYNGASHPYVTQLLDSGGLRFTGAHATRCCEKAEVLRCHDGFYSITAGVHCCRTICMYLVHQACTR
jgi:hypothetical protein